MLIAKLSYVMVCIKQALPFYIGVEPHLTKVMTVSANDKRRSQRYRCEVELIVTLMSGKSFQSTWAIDHSEYGMGIKSASQIKPGHYMMIRTVGDTAPTYRDDIEFRLPGFSVVEVKWCQESSGENLSEYLLGVRYVIPYAY